jgi:hypothetical protein
MSCSPTRAIALNGKAVNQAESQLRLCRHLHFFVQVDCPHLSVVSIDLFFLYFGAFPRKTYRILPFIFDVYIRVYQNYFYENVGSVAGF